MTLPSATRPRLPVSEDKERAGRRVGRERERENARLVAGIDSIFFQLSNRSLAPSGKKKTPAPASVRSNVAQQQETDPRRLEQRQKQIDFGKNTRGYQRYAAAVPR